MSETKSERARASAGTGIAPALRGLHRAWAALPAREVLALVPWAGDVPIEERPAAEALGVLFEAITPR